MRCGAAVWLCFVCLLVCNKESSLELEPPGPPCARSSETMTRGRKIIGILVLFAVVPADVDAKSEINDPYWYHP